MQEANDKNIIKVKISIPQIIAFIAVAYFIFVERAFTTIVQAFSVVIVSLIVIYIMNPLVKMVEKRTEFKKSRSVLLAIIIAIVGLTLFFYSIVPALVDSIIVMANTLPPAIQEVTNKVSKMEWDNTIFGNSYEVGQIVDQIIAMLYSYADVLIDMTLSAVTSVTVFTTGLFSSIFNIIFITMMSWYGLLEADNMLKQTKRFFYAILKKERADYIIHAVRVTDRTFKDYFISKAFICVILSVAIFVTIIIINGISSIYIPYAILFSVFLGITNFIPYVGPIIGTIPCVIITLITYGFSPGLALVIIVVVIQQFESMFLTPKVMKNSLGVNEFGIVASAAVGGALFGLTGMIISIPIIATIQVLLSEFIDKKEIQHRQLAQSKKGK